MKLTIWIESRQSEDAVRRLLDFLLDTGALNAGNYSVRTSELRTTVQFTSGNLQAESKDRIIRETMDWARTHNYDAIPMIGMTDPEACYILIALMDI